jgi:hypothetical protein
LSTPYIGLWVVLATFDASWAHFQIEDAPIPQKLTDATVCMAIKDRDNKLNKRWPEVTAIQPIRTTPGYVSRQNDFRQQERAFLCAANGRQLTDVNSVKLVPGRGIYFAVGSKNNILSIRR